MSEEVVIAECTVVLLKYGDQSWYVKVPKNTPFKDIIQCVKDWAKPLLENEDVAIS